MFQQRAFILIHGLSDSVCKSYIKGLLVGLKRYVNSDTSRSQGSKYAEVETLRPFQTLKFYFFIIYTYLVYLKEECNRYKTKPERICHATRDRASDAMFVNDGRKAWVWT